MDNAVRHHLNRDIKERTRLTGGYTFETWLLVLSDNQKVVFRTQSDFETGGGRKIIIADILEREKFFYDNVNRAVGHICPEVFVVDGTKEYYGKSFQISEYIEGTPLNKCFESFDTRTKKDILYKIGETAARINNIKIDGVHPYVCYRNSWEEYFADRLSERLIPLVKNGLISLDEVSVINEYLRNKKAAETMSFLHLDMRHVNMIHNNGNIFILDAENCEFGDPLFELATIDVAGELEDSLPEGYQNTYRGEIDLESDWYNFYRMERTALVLDLFMNTIKNDTQSTRHYLDRFNEIKSKLPL